MKLKFRPIIVAINLILLIFLFVGGAPAPSAADGPDAAPHRRKPNPAAPPLASQAGSAPGYCPSSGGTTEWEHIQEARLTHNPNGSMRLTVDVFISNPEGCTAGQECPEYDDSPEFINAWIDWNGDKKWDASERVMDAALTGYYNINYYGTMTAVSQFTPPAKATDKQTWLRVNLGWGSDPNNACQQQWEYGNVVDQSLHISKLKIKKITAAGLGTTNDKPETGSPVRLEAEFENPGNYQIVSCSWTGDLPTVDIHDQNNCRYEYTPALGPGPDVMTYGEKKVLLTVRYQDSATGAVGQVSKEFSYKVFFKKDGDDNGNGIPNWFEYWGDDGAVPGLNAPDVVYDGTLEDGVLGHFDHQAEQIRIGKDAAGDWTAKVTQIPAGPDCPGATFAGQKGIDSVAATLMHERRHQSIFRAWQGDGGWVNAIDTDDPTPEIKGDRPADDLPDSFEIETLGTNPLMRDSCNLAFYTHPIYSLLGDNELEARLWALGTTGYGEKDWANPGKQAEAPAGAKFSPMQSTALPTSLTSGPAGSGASTGGIAEAMVNEFANLTGNYSSVGMDTDGDGQINYLQLAVGLQVIEAAPYSLVAWLQDGAGTPIAWASASQTWSAGTHTAELRFDGTVIREKGLNGPYIINRVEVRSGAEDGIVVAAAHNVHTTGAYLVSQFEAPLVAFNGSFNDSGQVPFTGAGYYNRLRVNIGLNVQQAGSYTIAGQLDGAAGPVAVAGTSFNLNPGSQMIYLDFPGQAIYHHRQNGPYQLRFLRVLDSSGQEVDYLYNAYTTGAYSYSQFQNSSTVIDAGSFGHQTLDLNDDGDYEYLRVTFKAKVHLNGDYILSAQLKDSSGMVITALEQALQLAPGDAVPLNLDFPAGAITTHGANGPYQVVNVALFNPSLLLDFLPLAYTTPAYNYTDFAPPPVTLTGNYQDQGVDANGNGLYEALNIKIGLTPGEAGLFIASGRLLDSAGQEVGWATSQKELAGSGGQTVTLSFSGGQIRARGGDGPFTLADLLVYHSGVPDQDAFLSTAHTTAGYSHLKFEGSSNSGGGGGPQRVYIPLIIK